MTTDGSRTSDLFVGSDCPSTRSLADALRTSTMMAPMLPSPTDCEWPWREALDDWADQLREAPVHPRVVICTWLPLPVARPLTATEPVDWLEQVERPLATWFAALGAALDRCEDGGAAVVVVERPASLDSAGRATVTCVAEGLIAFARSAALVHGDRDVRVNVVTSQISTPPPVIRGMAPPLASFPGRPEHEIAGAVRMLLSSEAAGITGTVVRADCGRSW